LSWPETGAKHLTAGDPRRVGAEAFQRLFGGLQPKARIVWVKNTTTRGPTSAKRLQEKVFTSKTPKLLISKSKETTPKKA